MDLKHGVIREAAAADIADIDRAVEFLSAQAEALQHGLRHSDDPIAVAAVLDEHDASHDTWLCLAAQIERGHSPAIGDRFAELYAFHGRVAGSLERAQEGLMTSDVAGHVCGDLADRLAQLTETMTLALRGSLSRPAPLRTHRRSPG